MGNEKSAIRNQLSAIGYQSGDQSKFGSAISDFCSLISPNKKLKKNDKKLF